jgi:DHA1 family multidrug resistance protein-like MFS transporter
MNTTSRKSLFILSFTLLVVMLGYGMVMPIMPFYIEHFGAGGRELGWMMSTYSLMQLICAPMWGILSDRIGRKPVLTIGVLGYAITLLMFGLATNFWMLFLAHPLRHSLPPRPCQPPWPISATKRLKKSGAECMGQLGAQWG